jgi:hypothetical protein
MDIYRNIFTMHGPMNVTFPNNTNKWQIEFNSAFKGLNAELNPICHLLILLGDLTFMGPCIISISNKMQRYTVYVYSHTIISYTKSPDWNWSPLKPPILCIMAVLPLGVKEPGVEPDHSLLPIA